MARTIVVQPTYKEYVPYTTTIVENRAPTDESIRLYEEIKEKAYKSILDAIRVESNTLNLSAILYEDISTHNHTCQYKVKLNNEQLEGRLIISWLSLTTLPTREDIIRCIFTELSKDISLKLMQLMPDILQVAWGYRP